MNIAYVTKRYCLLSVIQQNRVNCCYREDHPVRQPVMQTNDISEKDVLDLQILHSYALPLCQKKETLLVPTLVTRCKTSFSVSLTSLKLTINNFYLIIINIIIIINNNNINNNYY